MATQNMGLFGISPEELAMQQEQQRQAVAEAYARDAANRTPVQEMRYGFARGGYGLGGALGGMLGGRDTAADAQMARAKQAQEVQTGTDFQDPEALMNAARALLQMGQNEAASRFVAEANRIKEQQSQQELRSAQAMNYERGGMVGAKAAQRELYTTDQGPVERDPATGKFYVASTNNEIPFEVISTLKLNKVGTEKTVTSAGVQFQKGADGYVYRMNKDGSAAQIVTKPDGTPLVAADASPELKAKMAEAAAGGTEVGKAAGVAQAKMPGAETSAAIAIGHVDKLLAHPGFKSAVGMGIPFASKMVGTPERDFANILAQTKGEAFLQAYTLLKGGGAIANAEGEKAQASINRMEMATSEKEFSDAAADYKKHIKLGMEALKKTAGMSYTAPASVQKPAAPRPPSGNMPKFSGIQTPQQVKQMYQSGQLTKAQANAILDDMKSRGLF